MTFSIRIRLLEGQRTSLVIPRSRIAPAVACALLAGTALMALSSGIAHAQQGLLYYVPNGVSDSVSVFSTNANGSLTPVTTISGIGNNPEQIAVRGDQAFAYVSLNIDNQLKVIDTRTNTVVQTLSTVTGPRGVAVSLNAMRVAVANNNVGVNTVSVFTADPLTGQLSPLATIPTGSNTQPRRVVFSPDSSRLFIANQGNLGANGSVSAGLPGSIQ